MNSSRLHGSFPERQTVKMAKVLLFQCENEREIRQILTPMKIQAVSVPKTKFHMTLKELERENDDEGYFDYHKMAEIPRFKEVLSILRNSPSSSV